MEKQKLLRDLLPFISYSARLQIMKECDGLPKRYQYVFGSDTFIGREVIEKYYPNLLNAELSDGIHGEGINDGIYIHLRL